MEATTEVSFETHYRITRFHKKFRGFIEERMQALIIRPPQPTRPAMKRLAVQPNADR
jgi:hypothetical protein